MINRVTLIGNLGKDPEIRRLENGAMVARLTLATNESYKDANGEWQKQTEWHTVVAWRLLAEKAEKTMKKGSLVYVEGKLTHRKYQDKDGQDRYVSEVLAIVLRPLDKREDGGGYFPSAADEPAHLTSKNDVPDSTIEPVMSNGNGDAPSDDLPF